MPGLANRFLAKAEFRKEKSAHTAFHSVEDATPADKCWERLFFVFFLWFDDVFDVAQVSRCCGLKLSSEGYVITLAKNNHYVLVLNTLYIL